jgi:hypothetical protein
MKKKVYPARKTPNTACTGQVRAFAALAGKAAPTADSASGGFIRQVPPLPVTPAVGPFTFVDVGYFLIPCLQTI